MLIVERFISTIYETSCRPPNRPKQSRMAFTVAEKHFTDYAPIAKYDAEFASSIPKGVLRATYGLGCAPRHAFHHAWSAFASAPRATFHLPSTRNMVAQCRPD